MQGVFFLQVYKYTENANGFIPMQGEFLDRYPSTMSQTVAYIIS